MFLKAVDFLIDVRLSNITPYQVSCITIGSEHSCFISGKWHLCCRGSPANLYSKKWRQSSDPGEWSLWEEDGDNV